MQESKPLKELALSLSRTTYTPIPFFLSLSLGELAEYAEMASKKP